VHRSLIQVNFSGAATAPVYPTLQNRLGWLGLTDARQLLACQHIEAAVAGKIGDRAIISALTSIAGARCFFHDLRIKTFFELQQPLAPTWYNRKQFLRCPESAVNRKCLLANNILDPLRKSYFPICRDAVAAEDGILRWLEKDGAVDTRARFVLQPDIISKN